MADIERFTKQNIEKVIVPGFEAEPGEKAEPIAMGRQTLWGGLGKPPSREVMAAAARAARQDMMERIRANKSGAGHPAGAGRGAGKAAQGQGRTGGRGQGGGAPQGQRPPQAPGQRTEISRNAHAAPRQPQRRDDDEAQPRSHLSSGFPSSGLPTSNRGGYRGGGASGRGAGGRSGGGGYGGGRGGRSSNGRGGGYG